MVYRVLCRSLGSDKYTYRSNSRLWWPFGMSYLHRSS
uniref:Uncharacterized protein n=1 Tax=Moniliophthora roreri TaxID=221103 RepID=A0A0W0G0N4_MONRR